MEDQIQQLADIAEAKHAVKTKRRYRGISKAEQIELRRQATEYNRRPQWVPRACRVRGPTTKIKNMWQNMRQRCYNPKASGYAYYGGKGVHVCDEWHEYSPFSAWVNAQMRALPESVDRRSLSIDRINPEGHYSPENCQIITMFANRSRAQRNNYT